MRLNLICLPSLSLVLTSCDASQPVSGLIDHQLHQFEGFFGLLGFVIKVFCSFLVEVDRVTNFPKSVELLLHIWIYGALFRRYPNTPCKIRFFG